MPRDHQSSPSLFTQIDIGASSRPTPPPTAGTGQEEVSNLLQQILNAVDRQNELLEELTANLSTPHRQRAAELGQWRQANPRLAAGCKQAAEALSRVQTEFLNNLTEEVESNSESLVDGEFVFNEFIDRYGPRLAHLNGMLQMLT